MSHNRNSQRTAFLDCIRNGDEEGVRRSLSTNENLDLLKEKFEQYRETALHLAVRYGQESLVKLLLQFKADIHATDLHLRTALHTAACDENDNTKIIALILKCEGVDVNTRDGYGNTSVKLAAERGNSNAVRLLMEKGADVIIADNADNTTLHVAAKKGHTEVLMLLLKTLVNTGIIGKQNKDKNMPLHLAVASEHPQCVAMLLNAGAASTMDVKNELGLTATDLAKGHGNKVIISLLENPQKAKEMLQAKPKSAKFVLGRGGSVELDSFADAAPISSQAVDVSSSRCPVFLSYQWDLQDTVKRLKSRIEESGIQCWMDVGQMGGGDALLAKIDAGVRACKVFVCCVTAKYCKSDACQGEATLAHNLKKPIIPLLFEKISWPPEGQLSLVFTKLLYIKITEKYSAIPDEEFQQLMRKVEQFVNS